MSEGEVGYSRPVSQLDRAKRFLRWVPTVPRQLSVTQESVHSANASLGELRAEIEAASKAQLEAMRFLTRAIDELGVRFERIEQAIGDLNK